MRAVAEHPQHSYDYPEMGLSDASYLAYLEVEAAGRSAARFRRRRG